jgi:hypothetical protein
MRRTRCLILTNRYLGWVFGCVCFTRRVVLSVLLVAVEVTDWLCCVILDTRGRLQSSIRVEDGVYKYYINGVSPRREQTTAV